MINHLKSFIQKNCILEGEYILSSGRVSNKYFDLRKATLNSSCLWWIFQYIKLHILWKPEFQDINIIGGPSVGSDFITAAIVGIDKSRSLQGSIVRKPKDHGTGVVIENLITEGARNILVVDDTLTTGGSIKKACNEFLKAGYNIKAIFVILDRSNGEASKIFEEKFGVSVISIFKEEAFNI
jgi:orotate phosphoribosyltransferase